MPTLPEDEPEMSYGKLFSSTFTGSMIGLGPDVFAVWAYVVSHAQASQVEINPILVGAMIGMPPARVEDAVTILCQPDPRSRNKAEEGRRLIREGEFAYKVVSHSIYREMRNDDARREYNRIKKQESRDRHRSTPHVNDIADSQPMSAQAESKTEAESKAERDALSPAKASLEDDLENAGVKLERNGEGLMPEWHKACKGLKRAQVLAILKETVPGIEWASEFKAERKRRGI